MFKSLIRNEYSGEEFELVEQPYEPELGICGACAFNTDTDECAEAPDMCRNRWRSGEKTVKVWKSISH